MGRVVLGGVSDPSTGEAPSDGQRSQRTLTRVGAVLYRENTVMAEANSGKWVTDAMATFDRRSYTAKGVDRSRIVQWTR